MKDLFKLILALIMGKSLWTTFEPEIKIFEIESIDEFGRCS